MDSVPIRPSTRWGPSLGAIPGLFKGPFPLTGWSSEAVSEDRVEVFLRKQVCVDGSTENGHGDTSLVN